MSGLPGRQSGLTVGAFAVRKLLPSLATVSLLALLVGVGWLSMAFLPANLVVATIVVTAFGLGIMLVPAILFKLW